MSGRALDYDFFDFFWLRVKEVKKEKHDCLSAEAFRVC